MPFKSLEPTQTRSQQVVAQIEQQIRSGELVRGEKLASEAEMAAQFGVSRSVVREAVKLLEAMGLVAPRQGSGSYVRNDTGPAVSRVLSLSVAPDEASVHELFEFRESLEATAARLAAERRTPEALAEIRRRLDANAATAGSGFVGFNETDWQFHASICEASGNRYLAVVLKAVREMQHDVISLITNDIGSLERAVDQHRQIADCIAAGSPDAADEAARTHVRTTAAVIEAQQKKR